MDLSTDNSMILFGIDGEIYDRSEVEAERRGRTVTDVVEEQLRAWLAAVGENGYETYVVQPGDTLVRIAIEFFGDPWKYELIAEHNGITDPDMLYVGRTLLIPRQVPDPADPPEEPVERPFRFPLDVTETPYFKFGDLYPPSSKWAGKPHPGVDFHQHEGAPVYAIGEGIVLVNKHNPGGYGHYILIEHTLARTGAQVFSLYGHLQSDAENGSGFRSPSVGTRLRGENIQIGLEGQTGHAGGLSHVHFEVKRTSELALYGMINTHNLRDYFHDPYTFIPRNEFRQDAFRQNAG
jgi:murein DD-endopeptidase MepM/ murein hydrolase activator NlpD